VHRVEHHHALGDVSLVVGELAFASTVMALNVSRADARSARSSSAGVTRASVVRKPSIVAMLGSIMPEPLAVPPTTKDPHVV
jgi:hypothetical protein